MLLVIVQTTGCLNNSNDHQSSELTTVADSIYVTMTADTNISFPIHWPVRFGFGRPVSPEEISLWDIDIMSDGTGLPPGRGTVAEGRTLYQSKCAVCHGPTGVEGPNDRLVGRQPRKGFPFGREAKYLSMRTIGNYWPYATTLFDYIRRAMPQTEPGSLSDDQVYALVAFLLHQNEIIPENAVIDRQKLPEIEMPARNRFVVDNRRGGNEIR